MAAGLPVLIDATDYKLIVGLRQHRHRISNARAKEMATALAMAIGVPR